MDGLKSMGRGTDQDDAIIEASRQLLQSEWPYDRAAMWSGNPYSAGPGWVALALPFVAAGAYPLFLLLFPVAALALVAGRPPRFSYATQLLVLTLSSLGSWLAMVSGAEVLALGFFFVVMAALYHGLRSPSLLLVVGFLCGMLSTGRVVFWPLPVLVSAHIFFRSSRSRGLLLGIPSLIGALGLHLAFYLANPRSYVEDGPLHVLAKSESYGGLTARPRLPAAARAGRGGLRSPSEPAGRELAGRPGCGARVARGSELGRRPSGQARRARR